MKRIHCSMLDGLCPRENKLTLFFWKTNQIITQWLALLRRVLGNSPTHGYGSLTLITQLPNRLDVISRDMATLVKYHLMHYQKTCNKCGCSWWENSDQPEPEYACLRCKSYNIKQHGFRCEVWHFRNMYSYTGWKEYGMQTFHKHYFINDLESTAFGYYDTLQWDNLFDDYY